MHQAKPDQNSLFRSRLQNTVSCKILMASTRADTMTGPHSSGGITAIGALSAGRRSIACYATGVSAGKCCMSPTGKSWAGTLALAHTPHFDAVESHSLLSIELARPTPASGRWSIAPSYPAKSSSFARVFEALSQASIDGFEPGKPLDLIAHYAAPLPVYIICEMPWRAAGHGVARR